jgi:hypothetical protein
VRVLDATDFPSPKSWPFAVAMKFSALAKRVPQPR